MRTFNSLPPTHWLTFTVTVSTPRIADYLQNLII